jgi:hypothetical protein
VQNASNEAEVLWSECRQSDQLEEGGRAKSIGHEPTSRRVTLQSHKIAVEAVAHVETACERARVSSGLRRLVFDAQRNKTAATIRVAAVLGGAHGAALLEALAAEDRPTLRWAEGDSGLLAALGTSGFGFGADLRAAACATRRTLGALGFAGFAAFGFVLEAFIGEKHLFAGGEDKLRTAFGTLQDFIVEFHEPLPLAQVEQGDGRTLHHWAE